MLHWNEISLEHEFVPFSLCQSALKEREHYKNLAMYRPGFSIPSVFNLTVISPQLLLSINLDHV
jgi:hypothetical protein